MEHAPSNCAYYDGGFCLKGLPGTLCELQGCAAWTDDLSVRPVATHIGREIKAGYEVKPLTWQDIKAIVEIADRIVNGCFEEKGKHLDDFPTEESYYKAVLEEYLKTKEK